MDEPSEREMLSKTHDVMETSLNASNAMTGLDALNTSEAVTVTDISASVPDRAEKREKPIEDSDGLNAMEETVRVAPLQMKRESVNEDDELNGLVTTASPSGLMLTTPLVKEEEIDSEASSPE